MNSTLRFIIRSTAAVCLLLLLTGGCIADEYDKDVFTSFDQKETWDDSGTAVSFSDEGIVIKGSGASAEGTVLTITQEGTYILSGTAGDGQIIVEADKSEKVRLVMNGITLSCLTSAPVWIKSADKVVITLAQGTVNTFADADTYIYAGDENEPNACIFSKDDLTINGSGTLTVNGSFNNGIGCKDDLKIISGTVNVTAKNNAVKGNDTVAIKGGTLTIESGNDGIKVENDTDTEKGYIYIQEGDIRITSGDDALQSSRQVIVTGGTVSLKAVGDTVNCEGETYFAEGCITEL